MLTIKEQKSVKMDSKCNEMLNSRTQLFGSAAKVIFVQNCCFQSAVSTFKINNILQALRMESINDLVEEISLSPAKNIFLGLGFSLTAVILLLGVFCGRISKRQTALKNK